MDNCIVNWWETFKGWTPYVMGLVVLLFWHYQKGKEVVASECKAYWTNLVELEIIYSQLLHNAQYNSDNFKEFEKSLESWKAINIPKIDLIKHLIKNDGKFVDATDKLISRYKSDKVLEGLKRFQSNESADDIVNKDYIINTINDIKLSLLPFIKYKFF